VAGQRLPQPLLPDDNHPLKCKTGGPLSRTARILFLNRGLQRVDVGSLQTLRPTHDFELNGLAVVQ